MSACAYLRKYYVRVCIFKNVEGTGVYIYISTNSRCVYCTSGVYIKESKNWVTVKQTANVKTCIFNLFSLYIILVLAHDLGYRMYYRVAVHYMVHTTSKQFIRTQYGL